MSKLIWLIWLLLLNGLTALALPTGIAEIPICSVHCPQPIVALSFDYDDSSTGIFDYDGATVYTASECASQSATSRALFATFANFLAADSGLVGVTSGESSALARQIYGIEVNGQPAVSSVEAFGSRAGSTFRGLGGPSATSDLDLQITLTDPAHFGAVNAEMTEIGNLFQAAKGFPLEPTYVIPGLPPPVLLKTPFIPLKP